jgi:hypothetical protein
MPLIRIFIGCVWVFKVKRDSNREMLKFKARVCARGDRQTREIDYNETFAPTLRYTTLNARIIIVNM